jgi:hypothetical protein
VLRRAKCYRAPFAVRPDKKTHGKGFAVRFKAFAVRSWRTAKALFPVVMKLILPRNARTKENSNSPL